MVTDRGIPTGERLCPTAQARLFVPGRQSQTHPALRRRTLRPHPYRSEPGRASAQGRVRRRPGGASVLPLRRARGHGPRHRRALLRHDLTEPSERLAEPSARKRIEQVRERIGRPKARSRGPPGTTTSRSTPTDRTARHRHPLSPTAAAGFDGDPSHPGVYRLRTNWTDWDGATRWRTRTHITPTTSRRSFAPRIRPASDPSPQAHPRRVPSVHHRHRPPTRAGDPHPSASGRSPRRLGPPSAGSSKAGNASPPPSDVTTNAPCRCARRSGPKRPDWPRRLGHPSCPGGPQ